MLLAGWVMGSRRPVWQADVGQQEISGSLSLEPNALIFLWLLAGLVIRLLGWQGQLIWELPLDAMVLAFLLHPVSWLQLGVMLLGYLACRLQWELRGKKDFE